MCSGLLTSFCHFQGFGRKSLDFVVPVSMPLIDKSIQGLTNLDVGTPTGEATTTEVGALFASIPVAGLAVAGPSTWT